MELFKLVGKLAIEGADEANKEIDGVTDKAGKFKSTMGLIGKGALVVTGAVATGTVALVKSVSGAYGELQQSIGGIETLFGESTAKIVVENANKAFQTAGVSANDYMQQVTSFSASLLRAVGGDTVKAAETADMAIRDMADNANKMGTSLDMIQNAYQGFAKQNYTMLDNLKLGYGGTKEEMARLLEHAQELTGVEYNINNLNDVYNAIHVIQRELGLTGTSADEAANTIQGSFGSLSAAWQNFLAGLGNPQADMEQLVADVASTLSGAINNITPIVENLTRVLPTVLDAIIESVMSMLPTLIDTFTELVVKVIVALISNLPLFLSGLVQLVVGLVNGLLEVLPDALAQLHTAVMQGIDKLITMIGTALTPITDMAKHVVGAFIEFFVSLPPNLLEICNNIIQAIISWGSNMIARARQIASDFTKTIINGLKNLPNQVLTIGMNLVTGLWSGIQSKLGWLRNKISDWCDKIVNSFMEAFDVHSPSRVTATIGGFIAEGLGVGILADDTAENAISEKAKGIIDIANGSLSNINVGANLNGLIADSPLQKYQLDFNAQLDSLNDGFERLLALVGNYLPDIAVGMERQIVLDGNALVVGMSKRMDTQFGKMATAKGRGNV